MTPSIARSTAENTGRGKTMTTIIKATMKDDTRREVEAVFPPDLDPRFDFARPINRLEGIQKRRLHFAAIVLGEEPRKISLVTDIEGPRFDPNIQTAGSLPERMTR
jgi:hypothetical protein